MKILLATDGSEYSESAAWFLTRLDLSPDDEITILHVVSWIPVMGDRETLYPGLKSVLIGKGAAP